MVNLKAEEKRLSTLKKYEILDTPADGNFDKITALTSKIFNMPISIISLVDEDRVWFKSQFGLKGVEQVGKEPGLCASAIFSDDIYVVEDAKNDPRTLANPLVCGEMKLRFYAAAPLETHDGFKLGTLCIIDKKQRYITKDQEAILKNLAEIVMDEIELRLAARNAIKKCNIEIEKLKKENKTLSEKTE